ncbi:hypothetical protein [Hyalangium rubrum]|uniref:Uncharacterized protein n=1 Tax=Hyalangium rubrum TaxID=3103134 RepID=A0ABU5HI48_9BACT|nr:hypothetical protein [Hyalangium sp. s54d21]MDY7232921.1 hypothetical protein [Hyalangium sp. s54d21]
MASSKRQWLGILVAVVASLVALGAVLLWLPDKQPSGPPAEHSKSQAEARPAGASPASPKAPDPGVEHATGIPAQARARLDGKATELAQQRLEQLPNPAVQDSIGGFSKQDLEQVLGSYREMKAVQGLYNQRVERERHVKKILESPHGVAIASKSLTDFTFAQEAFGEFQAEARYFSIDVLKATSSQGNHEPLMSTASQLAQQFALLSADSEGFKKGRREDLYDVLTAYIDVVGEDFLSSADMKVMQQLGYTPQLPAHVRKVYDDALFFRLNVKFGRQRAVAITSSLLGE